MYQKYQTEAIILSSREQGEADVMFALYTCDFGLVRARASAVRSEKSRMRYALQNYSRAHVGLVRGKHGWRIAGAIGIQGAGSGRGTVALARIARFITRLVAGEERNSYLFAVLKEAHIALMRNQCEAWATIEIVCVARSLHALGYLSVEALGRSPIGETLALSAGEGGTALFTHTTYEEKDIMEAAIMREKLLSSINRAIESTHL